MRAAVVGAGVVGLACAAELHRAGHDVRVLDPTPGWGATRAAAGMLSPAGEAWFGEEDLLRLGAASAREWPDYAARLERATGVEVDLRRTGSLVVGQDADDLAGVRRTQGLLAREGLRVEHLDRRQVQAHDPGLSRRVAGGALLPDDHQVNPRRVAAALLTLLGDRVEHLPAAPAVQDGRCVGVSTGDGRTHAADVVVVATGARLDPATGAAHLVRPVRGEIVRARVPEELAPPRTVRASVHGTEVYVVPRAGGEVVIGATSEEHAGEPVPTVGGVSRLLDAARLLLPHLDRAEMVEVLARHRPGTPDNGPLLGPGPVPGLYLAAGHHRGGVLLAPVTARAVRAHVEGGPVPSVAVPFHPRRFEERN